MEEGDKYTCKEIDFNLRFCKFRTNNVFDPRLESAGATESMNSCQSGHEVKNILPNI